MPDIPRQSSGFQQEQSSEQEPARKSEATERQGRAGERQGRAGERQGRRSAFVHLARVHALQTSGNAAIAIALANSLFFSIDPQAARGRIILYLLLSMAPFTLVAPMIGPAIDRIRSGHRVVVIGLLFGLGLVSFGMIGRVQSLLIFPLAFAILVFGKGYAVAKAAIVPSTANTETELVSHNSRLAVLSGIMSIVGAGPALLFSWALGSSWTVVLGMIQFFWAAILAFRLPKAEGTGGKGRRRRMPEFDENLALFGDSSADQTLAQQTAAKPPQTAASPTPAATPAIIIQNLWQRFRNAKWTTPSLSILSIRRASLAMMTLRGGLGFLTFFLAFHFRGGTDDVDLSGVGTAVGRGVRQALLGDADVQGAEPVWKLGILLFMAVAGGLAGSYLAPKLKMSGRLEERVLMGSLLLVLAGSLGAWLIGGLLGGMLLALVLGLAAGAGKVAFDSVVQRDAADSDYGRSFAVFETRFQLIWVFGAIWPVMLRIPFALGCILIGATAVISLAFSFFKKEQKLR